MLLSLIDYTFSTISMNKITSKFEDFNSFESFLKQAASVMSKQSLDPYSGTKFTLAHLAITRCKLVSDLDQKKYELLFDITLSWLGNCRSLLFSDFWDSYKKLCEAASIDIPNQAIIGNHLDLSKSATNEALAITVTSFISDSKANNELIWENALFKYFKTYLLDI